MKKIYLFMTMAMMAFATAFTACEDEQVNPNNDPSYEESENYDIYQINTTLSYDSQNPSDRSGYCAASNTAVSANNSAADICVGWVNDYGYFVCSPNASLLKQCYDANLKNYSSSKSTRIQSCSDDIADYYDDSRKFDNMTVSSEYINDVQSLGVGICQLSSGQTIKFQTSDGNKGIAKLSFSKVKKSVTLTGYVAVPKNSSGSK